MHLMDTALEQRLLDLSSSCIRCENFEGDVYTVFTNKPVSGAMRGYGIPQAMFAMESHTDDIAVKLGIPPYEYRWKYLMPKGYTDGFSKKCQLL